MLYDEIIRTRQAEIFNQVQDLDREILQLTAAIEKAKATKEQRIAEHNMLQHISDRGLMEEDNKKVRRIDFEDALKRIFDQAGGPMAIREVIDRLEQFGYMWSNYQSAWYRLRSTKLLEPTGARGYYNIIHF